MNLRLFHFFFKNDKDFILDLMKNLLEKCLFIEFSDLINSFQYFDNFSEINPYKNLSFSSKPHEILDFHYKRIIIISNLMANSFVLFNNLNFFLTIFNQIIKNFKENSSNLLLLFSIYSEIIMKDRSFLPKFKECSLEFLESVINMESYELQRSDVRDLETSVFSNLHTLKALINNTSKGALFINFLNEVFKLSTLERRKKMEEIYNKVCYLLMPLYNIYY